MFRLEEQLRRWRRSMIGRFQLSRPELEELESHLLEAFDDKCAQGLDAGEAFAQAVEELGSCTALHKEFAKHVENSRITALKNRLSFIFNKEVVMRVIAGLLAGISFVALGVLLEGGNFSLLTQFTALLIVGGGTAGALLMTYPLRAIANAMQLAITGNEATKVEYLEASLVFKTLGDLAILANFLSLCLGGVHVAEHAYTSPETIGLGLAVAFVASVYAIGIKMFIAKPMQDRFHALATMSGAIPPGPNRAEVAV